MRKPTVVETLRGEKVVSVAVGALHCIAVTDSGQVSLKRFIHHLFLKEIFCFITSSELLK